jgi:hypothetical protein
MAGYHNKALFLFHQPFDPFAIDVFRILSPIRFFDESRRKKHIDRQHNDLFEASLSCLFNPVFVGLRETCPQIFERAVSASCVVFPEQPA